MSKTPSLKLPLIQERQTQKHITVNEGLMHLDLIVQTVVESKHLNRPPNKTHKEGDAYIVGTRPGGVWILKASHVAVWRNGKWVFYPPRTGWSVWNKHDNRRYTYSNSSWRQEP